MSRTDFPEQLHHRYHPRRSQPPQEPPRRSLGDRRVLAGVGAAVALGLVGGLFMRPNLDDQTPAQAASARKVEIPTEPDGLDIIVDTRPPPIEPVTPLGPPAPYTAPMEGYTPQPVGQAPAPQPSPRASQAPAPAPRVVNGAVLRPYNPPREAPRQAATRTTRPSFNCRYARTASERMVCVDPQLAAADRRLASAYSRAIDSGVPERVLRRQQDVWLSAREGAARYGPQDVARVYEARIAELEQMR